MKCLSTAYQPTIKAWYECFVLREQNANLLKIAQYTKTLREQIGQVPSPEVASAFRNRLQSGRQTTLFEATVAEPNSRPNRNIHCIK